MPLTQGIEESHPHQATLSNSQMCSRHLKITQKTNTHRVFLAGILIVSHKHTRTPTLTHSHTHTHTLGVRESHPRFSLPEKVTNVVTRTFKNKTNTHKHPSPFSERHTQWASQRHTHTHTHSQPSHKVPSRGIHNWHCHSKLRKMVNTTHTHTTNTHKHPWSFGYRHSQWASHTHKNKNIALTQGIWV